MAKEKKNVVDKDYLTFIPMHKEGLEFSVDQEGAVTILQENKGPFYKATQVLMKKPRVSQIHLDEMGNFVWPLLDGTHTVSDVADAVKAHFGEKAEPVLDRLVQYLQTLEAYGFIQMMKKQ